MKLLRLPFALCLALTAGSCGESASKAQDLPPPTQAPPTVLPTAEHIPQVLLSEEQGEVEVRRGDVWSEASAGQILHESDAIRTAASATAVLKLGDVVVTLEPRSEVSVREISAKISNLQLERGLLAARVQGGRDQLLRVRAAGSSAVAESKDGSFSVYNDGSGLVAVSPSAGEVRLTSKGGDALLAAGQRGIVVDDDAPKVDEIPRNVLLKVNWPAEELARPRKITIRGVVDATSRVEVDGNPLPVSRDGHFEVAVDLQRGKNPIKIFARDAAGRVLTNTHNIKVSKGPPEASGNSKGIWK